MYLVGVFVLVTIGSCTASSVVKISPDEDLQDYLCNGSTLMSNTIIELTPGEHRISFGTVCSIVNVSNVSIIGSDVTTVRCQGSKFEFIFAQNVMIKKITFVGCGQPSSAVLLFQFSLNVSIRHCTFENNNAAYTVSIHSSWMVNIANCVFRGSSSVAQYVINAAYSDTVNVFDSLFHDIVVRAGVVELQKSGGSNTHIRNCTFRAVSGAFVINVSVAPNANAITTGTTQITDCLFQENSISGNKGQIQATATFNLIITNCTFQDFNTASTLTSSAVSWKTSRGGNIVITGCKIKDSSFLHEAIV